MRADGSGEPRMVREGGQNPRFNKDGTRLFYNDFRGGNFVLASVDLDGSDDRVHLQSANATNSASRSVSTVIGMRAPWGDFDVMAFM